MSTPRRPSSSAPQTPEKENDHSIENILVVIKRWPRDGAGRALNDRVVISVNDHLGHLPVPFEPTCPYCSDQRVIPWKGGTIPCDACCDMEDLDASLMAQQDADWAALPPLTEEQIRRAGALCAFRCPDHGCDLVECEDTDEHGPHVWYRCPEGDHHFGSIHDSVVGYSPMDDEIGVLAIELSEELR